MNMTDKFLKISIRLTDAIRYIVNIIYPPRCIICDELCENSGNIHICPACRQKISLINPGGGCKKCSRPLASGDNLCAACQHIKRPFDYAVSCALYEKDTRKSILRYKFSGAKYYYSSYGALLLEYIRLNPIFAECDVIIGAPLSNSGIKERGFDHIKPIVKYVSKRTGIKASCGSVIKIKETTRQSNLPFKERFLSVKGAYKVTDEFDFKGKTVLLIDDIFTTGATAGEISLMLKRALAAKVYVLTLFTTPNLEFRKEFLM